MAFDVHIFTDLLFLHFHVSARVPGLNLRTLSLSFHSIHLLLIYFKVGCCCVVLVTSVPQVVKEWGVSDVVVTYDSTPVFRCLCNAQYLLHSPHFQTPRRRLNVLLLRCGVRALQQPLETCPWSLVYLYEWMHCGSETPYNHATFKL